MILIVSATENEILPLLNGSNRPIIGLPFSLQGMGKYIDLLVTGVGAVQTTFYVTRVIQSKRYNLVINVGIAGAFSKSIAIGDVVVVHDDCFADLGVDNRGTFVHASDSGLLNPNQPPFTSGKLKWPYRKHFPALNSFRTVSGVTVSTASGSANRIETICKRFSPEIETMESAAIFYCCTLSNLPFICLRSISNYVEPRDVTRWNIPLAVENLCNATSNVAEKLKIEQSET